jgi:hypothetical protein
VDLAGYQWFMNIILASQEADIRRTPFESSLASCDSVTKTLHKNMASGVAQGESPEFKPQYSKKKKCGIISKQFLK